MTRIVEVELFTVTSADDTFNQSNYKKSKLAPKSTQLGIGNIFTEV